MPFDLAQYGIAFFLIGGLIYLGQLFIKEWSKNKACQELPHNLSVIIQNNTNAMEKMVSLLQMIQVSIAEQGVKIDHLLRDRK